MTGQADLVFDTIGGEVLAHSPALLRPGGTLVTIKADAQLPAGRDDIRTVVFIQESSRAQLTELARLVDQGQLRPQVGAVYPLAQAAEAFGAKAAGGIPGRIIRPVRDPRGRAGHPARAVAAAGLTGAAEAEGGDRLGGGRVPRRRVGRVVADQRKACSSWERYDRAAARIAWAMTGSPARSAASSAELTLSGTVRCGRSPEYGAPSIQA